jgi:hypothetical protein
MRDIEGFFGDLFIAKGLDSARIFAMHPTEGKALHKQTSHRQRPKRKQ